MPVDDPITLDDLSEQIGLSKQLGAMESKLTKIEGGIDRLVSFAERDDARKERQILAEEKRREESAEEARLARLAKHEDKKWLRGFVDNNSKAIIGVLGLLTGGVGKWLSDWLRE